MSHKARVSALEQERSALKEENAKLVVRINELEAEKKTFAFGQKNMTLVDRGMKSKLNQVRTEHLQMRELVNAYVKEINVQVSKMRQVYHAKLRVHKLVPPKIATHADMYVVL